MITEALQQRLSKRGFIKKDIQYIFFLIHGSNLCSYCPNTNNPQHECSRFCFSYWDLDGTPKLEHWWLHPLGIK
ncbi:hypothetical protein HZS_8081 [Henneguya salminicola]|nr:hypothetical protein HZS_8081 [Henneguya salminicola]